PLSASFHESDGWRANARCERLAAAVLLRAGVAPEGAGRRELTELVPDHVLGDVDRAELLAVVDGQRVGEHVGRDHRATAPRLDHALLAALVHLLDLATELVVDVGAFLERACHESVGSVGEGYFLALRRRTIMSFEALRFLRVLKPLAGTPV